MRKLLLATAALLALSALRPPRPTFVLNDCFPRPGRYRFRRRAASVDAAKQRLTIRCSGGRSPVGRLHRITVTATAIRSTAGSERVTVVFNVSTWWTSGAKSASVLTPTRSVQPAGLTFFSDWC